MAGGAVQDSARIDRDKMWTQAAGISRRFFRLAEETGSAIDFYD